MKRLRAHGLFALLLLLVSGYTVFHLDIDEGLAEELAHRYKAPAKPGDLTATWYGVSAVLLQDDRNALFIDPFFTRPPGLLRMLTDREIAPDEDLIRQVLSQTDVPKLDAVIVSHSHFDHAMDAPLVARIMDADLVGSESTANLGRGAALADGRLKVPRPGETLRYGRFSVRLIESRHAGASGGRPTGMIGQPLKTPAHYSDYRLGGTYSILIEHPQGRVLHHGSAGYLPGALQGERADVVFLGIALLPQLRPYLQEVVDAVGARRVIPVHWDNFTRPLSEPLRPFPFAVWLGRFFDRMEEQRPELQVQTLPLGEPVALFPAPEAPVPPTPPPAP